MQKKWIAGVLTTALCMTSMLPVYAAENQQSGTTTVTATVPSEYFLTIPSGETIELTYGKEETEIGSVKVTGNVRPAEQVKVEVEKTSFENLNKKGSSFAFELLSEGNKFESAVWSETELCAETAKEIPLTVRIPSSTWNTAASGDYEATITFHARIEEAQPMP